MLEIPWRSEVINVISFFVLDILLLSYIMYMSGLLAGHANYAVLRARRTLHLVVFNFPLIGGGVIMQRGWRRGLIIFLRLSVFAAVAACNFGIEGRSNTLPAMTNVRVPGPLSDPVATIFNVTEPRMQCFNVAKDGNYHYGLVAGGRCYPDITDHIYISSLRLGYENIQASAKGCRQEPFGESQTLYRCDAADLICLNFRDDGSCNFTDGVQQWPGFSHALVYSNNDTYAWMCENSTSLVPGEEYKELLCRGLGARRHALRNWVDIYRHTRKPGNMSHAVFASAYGVEKQVRIKLPDGKKQSVTVLGLWWIVSTLWVVAVTAVLTLWWLIHMFKGSLVAPHDERALVALLHAQIEHRLGDNCMPAFNMDEYTDEEESGQMSRNTYTITF